MATGYEETIRHVDVLSTDGTRSSRGDRRNGMADNTARVDRLAISAAFVTVTLWASAFVGIRAVVDDFGPGALAVGRLAVGSIALGLLVGVRGWKRPSRRDLGLIVASGLLWFALYNLTLNEAERNLDAGTAAMLVNTGPISLGLLEVG